MSEPRPSTPPPIDTGASPPGSPPDGHHKRRASVPLSPFWTAEGKVLADLDAAALAVPGTGDDIEDDNEAIASPRVHSRGVIEVPMSEIAFFPLPLDDCASDERAIPPEKRLSRRASSAKKLLPPRVPSVVAAVEGGDGGAVEAAAAADSSTKAVDSGMERSGTSISSDTTVASVQSEFSENTAGSTLFIFVDFAFYLFFPVDFFK